MAKSCDTDTDSYDLKQFGLQIERLYEDSIFRLFQKPLTDTPQSSQLEELQETKEKLEQELNEAKTVLYGYRQKACALKEEYEKYKNQTEELTNRDQTIARKKAELEKELVLLEKTKVNSHDEELVEKYKLQYKCLRNMTQIRFSYNKSDEDQLEGYVFNKVTRKITPFSINISELDNDQVQDHLMKLMKDNSHPSYADVSSE